MTITRRPSEHTRALVDALAAQPTVWRYGYELVTELGLKSGSLYPILMRLADRGLLEASWETDVGLGRPPRHRYRLTSSGVEFARAVGPALTQLQLRLRPREA